MNSLSFVTLADRIKPVKLNPFWMKRLGEKDLREWHSTVCYRLFNSSGGLFLICKRFCLFLLLPPSPLMFFSKHSCYSLINSLINIQLPSLRGQHNAENKMLEQRVRHRPLAVTHDCHKAVFFATDSQSLSQRDLFFHLSLLGSTNKEFFLHVVSFRVFM